MQYIVYKSNKNTHTYARTHDHGYYAGLQNEIKNFFQQIASFIRMVSYGTRQLLEIMNKKEAHLLRKHRRFIFGGLEMTRKKNRSKNLFTVWARRETNTKSIGQPSIFNKYSQIIRTNFPRNKWKREKINNSLEHFESTYRNSSIVCQPNRLTHTLSQHISHTCSLAFKHFSNNK